MYKQKRRKILSDSEESNDSDSEVEVSAAKRSKLNASPPQNRVAERNSSTSATSEDDDEWTMGSKKKKKGMKKHQKSRKAQLSKDKVLNSGSSSDDDSDNDEKRAVKSRPHEDGELAASSSDAQSDEGGGGKVSDEDDDDDDGELSSYDEEELRKEFDDGYDNELVGDEEDRKKLENMTEKEREQELYNRLEKREALEKRFEIEKKLRLAKLRNREKKNQFKKKTDRRGGATTSSSSALYEKSSPSSGKAESRIERRRKMEEKKGKKTLEDLKAERERKKNRNAQSQDQSKKRVLKVCDIYSDDDDDDDDDAKNVAVSKSRMQGRVSESESSDSDSDNSSNSDLSEAPPEVKVFPIETKEELNKIRLTRNELGRWVHHPMFKQIVMGCYVRIGIGNNDGKPVYRIAEIVDVCETGKVYQVNAGKTNVGLRLKHGKQERVFRIAFVSNAGFSDSEFFKWKQGVAQAGQQLPSNEDVKKRLQTMHKLKMQKLQDQDVDHIVKQKQKFRKNPFNYAMKKTDLLKQKEMAETTSDNITLARVNAELLELEERAEKLDKQRQENIAGITHINDRIKTYNLLKDQACVDEFKERQENVADPFTRRRCKPVIVSNTEDGMQTQRLIKEMDKRYGFSDDKDKTKAKADGEKGSDDLKNGKDQNEKNKELVHNLFDAHDFDIKLDVQVPTSSEPALAAAKVSINPAHSDGSAPRRSLNLSDYKKRRGLI